MLVAAYEIYDKCYTLRRFHQNDIFKFKRFKVINTFYNFILFFISVIINRIKFKFVNQEKKQVLLQKNGGLSSKSQCIIQKSTIMEWTRGDGH